MKFQNAAEAKIWSEAFDTAAMSRDVSAAVHLADRKVAAMRERSGAAEAEGSDPAGIVKQVFDDLAHDLEEMGRRIAALESREDTALVRVVTNACLDQPHDENTLAYMMPRLEAHQLGFQPVKYVGFTKAKS